MAHTLRLSGCDELSTEPRTQKERNLKESQHSVESGKDFFKAIGISYFSHQRELCVGRSCGKKQSGNPQYE